MRLNLFFLTTLQLRFSLRFFFVPKVALKIINNFNFVFLRFARGPQFFISDFGLFDLCVQRMQYFIKYLGYKNSSFLGVIRHGMGSNMPRHYSKVALKLFLRMSRWFCKPTFDTLRYRPGLFTNWRSNIAKLFIFRDPASRLLVHFSKKTFEKKRKPNRYSKPIQRVRGILRRKSRDQNATFPAVLLTFDSFHTIYLFSEAERLSLPVIGPFSIYLNFSFWTYTYPVYTYSNENTLFFIRLFAINFLKGRLSFFLLNI